MTTKEGYPRCLACGTELEPAPASFDGEPTQVGYLPCRQCAENQRIADYLRDYWKHLESGAD